MSFHFSFFLSFFFSREGGGYIICRLCVRTAQQKPCKRTCMLNVLKPRCGLFVCVGSVGVSACFSVCCWPVCAHTNAQWMMTFYWMEVLNITGLFLHVFVSDVIWYSWRFVCFLGLVTFCNPCSSEWKCFLFDSYIMIPFLSALFSDSYFVVCASTP